MLIDSANIQFKEYSQGMDSLFPSRLDENISSDAPVRLVNRIVDELDISPLLSTYKGGGCPAYYPRMLLKVLFFAYLNNVYSCRKIARLLQENILYMWLSGKSTPDFRTINDFRSKRLKSCIHSLFTQIVLMLVDLGYISLEKQLSQLDTDNESRRREADFLRFEIEEIENAQLKAGEEDCLAACCRKYGNARRIMENLSAAYRAVDTEAVGNALHQVCEVAEFDPELKAIQDQLYDGFLRPGGHGQLFLFLFQRKLPPCSSETPHTQRARKILPFLL